MGPAPKSRIPRRPLATLPYIVPGSCHTDAQPEKIIARHSSSTAHQDKEQQPPNQQSTKKKHSKPAARSFQPTLDAMSFLFPSRAARAPQQQHQQYQQPQQRPQQLPPVPQPEPPRISLKRTKSFALLHTPQDDMDAFLSSDLELSFASNMSLHSPDEHGPPTPGAGLDVDASMAMDISPAPVRYADTRVKMSRPRAYTSGTRLFGRDVSNDARSPTEEYLNPMNGTKAARPVFPEAWFSPASFKNDNALTVSGL
jgi:hypothetical protein